MRSIWRGAVSFGLVSIGVKLYSATEDKDVRFHQVHVTDGGRIKYKRVCSIDGEEVEYSDIAKGYELPDGQVVILTDEDFDDLPLSTRREIEVLRVRRPGRDRPDHVREDLLPRARRPGRPALRAAARRPGERRPGRDHQDRHPAARSRSPCCACATASSCCTRCGGPTRSAVPTSPSSTRTSRVRPQELKMAEALIASMTGEFDPSRVHRRLPRGHDRAAGGQAERRRGAAGARGRPTTAPRSST